MRFDSFDAVFFTVGFLVPGFIWSAVLSMLVPRRTVGGEVRMVEFLTFSCINHGIWSWAIFLIFKGDLIESHPYLTGLSLLIIIGVSPVALGILSAWLQQRQAISRFLGRFGFRTIDPIPTAWDWHFSRLRPLWVLVTLKDGSKVFGFFGDKSFAGSDPEHRDLFVEKVFHLVEDTGDWAPVVDSGGILILEDQIAAIEFRTIEGEEQ